jgi:hypothetical protein
VDEFPPLLKGGQGEFLSNALKIPLNPPFAKGDFECRFAIWFAQKAPTTIAKLALMVAGPVVENRGTRGISSIHRLTPRRQASSWDLREA